MIMDGELHITPEVPQVKADGMVEVGAEIRIPNRMRERLWYRIPVAWQDAVTRRADPFAIAMTMFAMHQRTRMVLHGPVSRSLLSNLEEFQTIWNFWKPHRYSMVALDADAELDDTSTGGRGAVVGFSGGADACYTVQRHVLKRAGRRTVQIRAGMLLQGFDIPLNDPSFERAGQRAQAILASVQIPLILASTNWRTLQRAYQLNWEDSFGSAIVACLSLLASDFRYGLLASGDCYYRVRPHGSTPLTDPLLGSDAFIVRTDGGAASRVDKIRAIASWPEATEHLRVCWEGEDRGGNCGRCEKCLRTILNFRAVGKPLPPCFPRDVKDEDIQRVPIRNSTQRNEFESILRHAHANGLRDAVWVKMLESRLRDGRKKDPLWVRLRRRVAVSRRLRQLQDVLRRKRSS